MAKLLQFRVPEALYDTIRELAEAEGKNVSETARILLAAGLDQVTDKHIVRVKLDDEIEQLQARIDELRKHREWLAQAKEFPKLEKPRQG